MNVPGVAEYQEIGGQLIPKLPTADMCAGGGMASGAGGFPLLPIVGLAAAGAVAYFFLR